MAVIGFPRESHGDRRTLLTPDLARQLVEAGFCPVAESGLGAGIGLSDAALREAGVALAARETVWDSPLILRYRGGDVAELAGLRPDQALGALLHAEGDPALMAALVRSGAHTYAFEFIEEQGQFPTGAPGGEIAGVQAVLHASQALQSPQGRGVLLARVAGASSAHVVILGSGHAGSAAARTAAALGARVTVLTTERSLAAYRQVAPAGVAVWPNTPETLRELLPGADVVIGTLLISTVDTPAMLTEADLDLLPTGATIVDVTCGYGDGYLPTAGPVQAPGEPPRLVRGVYHVKLDALPAMVPRTASAAYARHMAPYLVRLAQHALHGVRDEGIHRALVAAHGRLIHPVCREHAAHWRAVADAGQQVSA